MTGDFWKKWFPPASCLHGKLVCGTVYELQNNTGNFRNSLTVNKYVQLNLKQSNPIFFCQWIFFKIRISQSGFMKVRDKLFAVVTQKSLAKLRFACFKMFTRLSRNTVQTDLQHFGDPASWKFTWADQQVPRNASLLPGDGFKPADLQGPTVTLTAL